MKKPIVIHHVNMEAPAWQETSAHARMVMLDQDVKRWFVTDTVTMEANAFPQMSASVRQAGMGLHATQLFAARYA